MIEIRILKIDERINDSSNISKLPTGHVLSKKPLAEKLILDRVEVTPIQMMGIGASLEIGAVQSLMEGLQHHRYAASTPIIKGKLADNGEAYNEEQYALFYAEWEPNNSDRLHRYLIEVRRGEDVYVGYFPFNGRKPQLYGIYHKKMEAIKFLHKTHSATLRVPELNLLTELNVPNITFEMNEDEHGKGCSTTIRHKQGSFYSRSIYGDFTPLLSGEVRIKEGEERQDVTCNSTMYKYQRCTDEEPRESIYEKIDSTGFSMYNPRHPYYMFQGATGYIQFFEGKMFSYPDGSIRFLTKEQEESIFRGYNDLQIVQGDLIAYELEGHTVPEPLPQGMREYSIDRHNIKVGWHDASLPETEREEVWHDVKPCLLKYDNLDGLYIGEDCVLTITHPEHGETKYEALKGEMLALLPGTSRPFQKNEERN